MNTRVERCENLSHTVEEPSTGMGMNHIELCTEEEEEDSQVYKNIARLGWMRTTHACVFD